MWSSELGSVSLKAAYGRLFASFGVPALWFANWSCAPTASHFVNFFLFDVFSPNSLIINWHVGSSASHCFSKLRKNFPLLRSWCAPKKYRYFSIWAFSLPFSSIPIQGTPTKVDGQKKVLWQCIFCSVVKSCVRISHPLLFFSFLQRKEMNQKKAPSFALPLRGAIGQPNAVSQFASQLHGADIFPTVYQMIRRCAWSPIFSTIKGTPTTSTEIWRRHQGLSRIPFIGLSLKDDTRYNFPVLNFFFLTYFHLIHWLSIDMWEVLLLTASQNCAPAHLPAGRQAGAHRECFRDKPEKWQLFIMHVTLPHFFSTSIQVTPMRENRQKEVLW